MRFRERFNEDSREEEGRNPAGNDPAGGNLENLRQAGESFLSAGDEAIRNAISGDSSAFLEASKQLGGE